MATEGLGTVSNFNKLQKVGGWAGAVGWAGANPEIPDDHADSESALEVKIGANLTSFTTSCPACRQAGSGRTCEIAIA